MKPFSRKIQFLILGLLCNLSSAKVSGQSMLTASVADPTFVNTTGVINLSNAVYDGTALIEGVTWDAGGSGYFRVRDAAGFLATQQIPQSPGDYITFHDMVIGAQDNSSTEYYVGIIYHFQNLTTSEMLMDVYKLEYMMGTLQITGSQTQVQIATNIGIAASEPRIDLINKDGGSGVVISDRFVATWMEYNSPNTDVMACTGKLSDVYNNGNTNVVVAGPMNSGVEGFNPDICGIERNGGNDDIAYIVFNRGSDLFPLVTEWNISTSTITPNTTPIDFTAAVRPRIDGLDPHSQAGNGEDYYITYTYNVGGGLMQVRSYTPGGGLLNNTLMAFNGTLSTNTCTTPLVVCAPDDDYNVVFFSQGYGAVVLEEMDWYNNYDNNVGMPQDYFRVNRGGAGPIIAHSSAWGYSSGVVKPTKAMVSWFNPFPVMSSAIKYKTYSSLTTNPFKPETTLVGAEQTQKKPSIHPNPANDILYVSNLDKSTKYTISDIVGRVVISGDIERSTSQIQTTTLKPGTYILNLGNQEHIRFIKE